MKKLKITSLILAALMVFSMLPFGMISAFARNDDEELELLESGKLPNGTSFFTRDMAIGTNPATGRPLEEYTVPVTDGYKQGLSGKFTPLTNAWYGAEGLLLSSLDFLEGEMQLTPFFEVEAAFGGDINEYSEDYTSNVRGKTNPNALAWAERSKGQEGLYEDWTSTAYLSNDGINWVKQEISTLLDEDPVLAESPLFKPQGYRYMYIPLSSFRYTGASNNSTVGIDTRIGMPFFEFLSIFEKQSVKLNFEVPANETEYSMNLQFVYAEQTVDYDPETAVTEPITFKHLTIGDSSGIQYPNYYTTQTDGSTLLPVGMTEIITEKVPVNGNNALTEKGVALINNVNTDLSNVAGIRFTVDTSALGSDAQLMLRVRLRNTKKPSDLLYNTNAILNAYTSSAMGPTEVYTGGATVGLTHRGADSVAYYKGMSGKKEVSGVLYTNGTDYTSVSSDGFLLPANFVGEIYIPLSSYHVNVTGAYSSAVLIPYISEDGGIDGVSTGFNYVNQIAINSNINGEPEEATVSYDNIAWVYASDAPDAATAWMESELVDLTPDEIEIDSKEELLYFAKLLNTETFDGKTIKLNNDIILNRGWLASEVNMYASLSEERPDDVWPVAAGAWFAGTFDGQGHTISGIYMKTSGDYAGIFGNVPTQKTATVKNLAIVNSYVESSGQGVGAIFGQIDNETTTLISDLDYVNATKGVIDNVYLDAIVYGSGCMYTTALSKDLGVGGFIGGSRADASITNSVFAGTVYGHLRGVAAFIGATRPYQASSTNYYRATITIENCVSSGDVIAPAEYNNSHSTYSNRASYGFVGGLVGYANGNTNTFNITNVLLTGKIVDGVTYYETNEETFEKTLKLNGYVGYLYGGCWGGTQSNRAPEYIDFQIWNLNNVKYLANSLIDDNNGQIANAIGNASSGQKYVVDGKVILAKNVNAALSATDDRTIPGILAVRPNAEMQATVSFDGNFDLSLTLDASNVVVKDKDMLTFKVNGVDMDVALVNGKYTITYQNIDLKDIDKEYSIFCTIPKQVVFMNFHVDENGNALDLTVGGTASVKEVLSDLLASETMGADVKAYASDLLRLAADAGADISDITLTEGNAAPDEESEVEIAGEVFTGASLALTYPDLVVVTVKTNGNAGVVSATVDGEAVAMTQDGDDLLITLSVKDLDKVIKLTNGRESWTGTVEAVAAANADAATKLAYAYAVSAGEFLN